MWYVYSRYVGTGPYHGKEGFVGRYETEKEAANKIASCYKIDAETCQQDEYYYFMEKR